MDYVIQRLQENNPVKYDLRNFQAHHLGSDISLSNLAGILKKIYWFSLNEEYALSYKLLQCQLYGEVNEEKLKDVLSKSYNVRTDQSFQLSSKNIADIKSLISIDIQLYKMVVVEFTNRINQYASCLNKTTDISHLQLLNTI